MPESRCMEQECDRMTILTIIIAFLAGTLIGAIIMALAFAATRSAEKRGGIYELHRKRRTRWKIKLVQLVRKMMEACAI